MSRLFDELMKSVLEMDDIIRGSREPSRVLRVEPGDIRVENQADRRFAALAPCTPVAKSPGR
nr:hypothetical protein [Luteibacter rhizovicinus]